MNADKDLKTGREENLWNAFDAKAAVGQNATVDELLLQQQQ